MSALSNALADLAAACSEFGDNIHGVTQAEMRIALAEQRRERADARIPEPEWREQLEDLVRAIRLSGVHDRVCEVCGHSHVAISVSRRLFDDSVDLPAPADDDSDPNFIGLCGLCFKTFRAQRRPSCALQ